jgi:high-affinity iron transporter
MRALIFAIAAAILAFVLPGAASAQAADGAAMAVHLLDYLGADYGGAVRDGKIASADEYKEMQEFSAQIVERVQGLPANPARDAIAVDSQKLASMVADKAAAQTVAAAAVRLRWALIAAYRIPVAPATAPTLSEAPALYALHCASCHGTEGRGDGPAAKALDPAPANFHDAARMTSRSVYGLYSSISLGVQGTAMPAFAQLPDKDRWALAFHVANIGVPAERATRGEALWQKALSGTASPSPFPDMSGLVNTSAEELRQRSGEDAVLLQDYLRAHPGLIESAKPAPLSLSRSLLAKMLAAYGGGDKAAAGQLAVSAYLDGFEPVESGLDAVDHDLRLQVEHEMLALRAMVNASARVEEVAAQTGRIDALLARADEKLSAGDLSPGGAFISSFIILAREGLEAILILAAIIAFVSRTGRRDAMRWVHAGWIAALALGIVTWAVASYLLDFSGANREMTSGVTALIAAGMLLYVGWWLHGRTQAQEWSRFLRDQVSAALEQKTLWAVASVSFLAVYRELFEVILFYEALWIQAGAGGQHAVLGGVAAAALLLAVVGWGIFKYSLRLPLKPFFAAMTVLMVLLAVVFAGQGIAALQEAGVMGIRPVSFVAVPLLGVHPTMETLGAQLAVLVAVAVGYLAGRRKTASPT